jgi:hypothetical protein
MRVRGVRFVAAGIGVLVLAGCTTALAVTQSTPGSHVSAISFGGQRGATLAVVSGAASVTVTAGATPGTLARAWTPAHSGIRPVLSLSGGTVRLVLNGTGQAGPDAVWVELSSAVRWRLRLAGGASEVSLRLGHGRIAGIDFVAGVSRIDATLPRPAGTVTITLAGGASELSIDVPAAVPARLQLFGGAAQAVLAGRVHTGIGGGTVLTAPGWASARDRYDLDATAGVSSVSVTG